MPQQGGTAISKLEQVEAAAGGLARERLRRIREVDLSGEWDYGAHRDVVHWLSATFKIAWIDATRRVEAAHAIEHLPVVSEALQNGEVSLELAVQLTRFATPETEAKLLRWSKTVSLKCVREAADEAHRADLDEVRTNDASRSFGWRTIEGGRATAFFGRLPAEQAAVVTSALERTAHSIERMPHEEVDPELIPEPAETLPQRRADALLLMASQRISDDFDADRSTVVIHTPAEALTGIAPGAHLEGGSLLHPKVAERLLCDARIQTVVENGAGDPIGIGWVSETVPRWLKRLVKYRDRGCVFPGCEDMRYNQAHHMWWWGRGGPTDLDNLCLLCGFHHKAVHEYGWSVSRRSDGAYEWFLPSGRLYGVRLRPPPLDDLEPPGPEPPELPIQEPLLVPA